MEFFSLGMATDLKENSEVKPVLFCLKIDFVLHPACGKKVGLIYTQCNPSLSYFWVVMAIKTT